MKSQFLLIILLILVSIQCSRSENRITFKLKIFTEYGRDTLSVKSLIGFISDVTIDSSGNVYVLDKFSKTIKKYQSDGQFVDEFGFGEGEGPGELLNPKSIQVDDLGNIYVTDINKKTLTVYNNKNKLVIISKLPFWPAELLVTKPYEIFVIGFPFTYSGDLIYRYLIEKDILVLKSIFCRRIDSQNRFEIEHTGNAGRLICGEKDELVYSFSYPYEIRKYKDTGTYINKLTGNVNFFETPYYKRRNIIETTCGTSGLVYLRNNILVNVIYKKDDSNMDYYFDFIDYKKMKYLGTINSKDFGFKVIRHVDSDKNGNLYLSIDEPYPKVVKVEYTFKCY